jgi:hypothetical protein
MSRYAYVQRKKVGVDLSLALKIPIHNQLP